MSDFREIQPKVDPEAEFLEIANDFGDPLEVLREALSNSYDHDATTVTVTFSVQEIDGADTLVIEIEDDGEGMSETTLEENFWDLGNSASRHDNAKIGEKGHGTKIFLRSSRIGVVTHHKSGSWESVCENPYQQLCRNRAHKPRIRPIQADGRHGTLIRLEGYNNNERSRYRQSIVKDYLYWFTILGSFREQFEGMSERPFAVRLKCLDEDEHECLEIGHIFARPTPDIEALFDQHGPSAAEYFVKKYTRQGTLPNHPEVRYQAVVYVEGDKAKRAYNPLIGTYRRKGVGRYRVRDRYGIYIAKDYMPIQRANDWISGFGSGSNAFVLLHGFVNCQNLRLTANRGSIANTDPAVLADLRSEVQSLIEAVDADLYNEGLYTLQDWQAEKRTLNLEAAEFKKRTESIATRRFAVLEGRTLLQPQNESELFGLVITIAALRPAAFPFEILDYNTTRGIDILARNPTEEPVADCKYWYVELKYELKEAFNHSFDNINWILCWDFHPTIKDGAQLVSTVTDEERTLRFEREQDSRHYHARKADVHRQITVIRLREYLENNVGLTFQEP